MEATYRRTVAGKQKNQSTKDMQKGDKRRLVQLLVSLCLFLVVFFGRDAFPAQLDAWNDQLTEDTDFRSLIAEFSEEMKNRKTVWPAFSKFVSSAFGSEPKEQTGSPSSQSNAPDIQIALLSTTSRCGLQHIRENSFLENLRIKSYLEEKDNSDETIAPPAEIVTAVAQAYSPDGESLPKKVSFQFYELGLEKTVSPVMGTITSEFGYRIGPISGEREFHLAIDIAAAKGTEIQAFADGVVRYIGENNSFGLYLMIDHDNGVSTFYAHCSKLLVRKGDTITCGQTVALVGDTGNATGPHLHLTIAKDGIRLDPAYYVAPEESKQA